MAEPIAQRFLPVRRALERGESLRVVFVNDCGFIAGAGMAQRRQAISMLAAGHDVSVVCSLENPDPPMSLRARELKGSFAGVVAMPGLNGRTGPVRDPERITEQVRDAVLAQRADLAIVGNLHWTGWPVSLPRTLTEAGVPTVAYMHDCYFFTGRCVHPGACTKFEAVCDSGCPTPEEYPPLAPSKIRPAHEARRAMFAAPMGVPIAGNSAWTVDMCRRGLGPEAEIGLAPLGLDENLFCPIERSVARRLLGLPLGPRIMLFGATDISNENKGGPFMRRVCEMLADERGLMLCAFGHNSNYLKGVHGFGHITDERLMPLLYAASDFYVSFSKEESFGQTSMEAAACERPVIARRSGGIVEIVRDGENGVIVWPDGERAFADACLEMASDPDRRNTMGAAGRELVLARHTMDASRRALEDWIGGLADLSERPSGHPSEARTHDDSATETRPQDNSPADSRPTDRAGFPEGTHGGRIEVARRGTTPEG